MRAPRVVARPRHLFSSLSSTAWINLALAACGVFFVVQLALDLAWNNFCSHLGIDFCAFWSAGRAANLFGLTSAYDPAVLGRIQSANLPSGAQSLAVSPIAYLPVFLLPFRLLAELSPNLSFWLWTLLNAVGYVAYLRFLCRTLTGRPLPMRLLAMLTVSLPVYWNFLNGQVNVWLMICVGEFLRMALTGKPFRAGLWLGGLLLKPQTVILLAIALALRRSVRILAGLAASATVLLTASWILVGTRGMTAVLRIWLGFAQGLPTNDIGLMMNWRMLGLHLSQWISPDIGWGIAAAGTLLTAAAGLWLSREQTAVGPLHFVWVVIGVLAATALAAWHSHIHMAMMLIPPLLLLVQQEREVRQNAFNAWVLIPSATYILAYLLAAVMKVGAVPTVLGSVLDFVRAASEFGVNVWILLIAVRAAARNDRQLAPAAVS